jgi:hypothetical protein
VTARRLSRSIAVVGAAGMIAGCGSGASSQSTPQTVPPTSTAHTTTPSAPTASAIVPSSTTQVSTTPTTSPSTAASPLANCLNAVSSQRGLTAKQISQLDQVCQAVRGGDQAKVRAQTEQACRNFVNSSRLPAGPARTRALAACKQP